MEVAEDMDARWLRPCVEVLWIGMEMEDACVIVDLPAELVVDMIEAAADRGRVKGSEIEIVAEGSGVESIVAGCVDGGLSPSSSSTRSFPSLLSLLENIWETLARRLCKLRRSPLESRLLSQDNILPILSRGPFPRLGSLTLDPSPFAEPPSFDIMLAPFWSPKASFLSNNWKTGEDTFESDWGWGWG